MHCSQDHRFVQIRGDCTASAYMPVDCLSTSGNAIAMRIATIIISKTDKCLLF